MEADPLKGSRSRRKVDVLGMVVGIIGSKDQLVNEYRVMLAEKLLNKSDYDIDTEIRTLELLKVMMKLCKIFIRNIELKCPIRCFSFSLLTLLMSCHFVHFCQIHFGESSMHKCEIMLNDLIDSKRTNTNIKATLPKASQAGTLTLCIFQWWKCSDLSFYLLRIV